MIVSSFQSLPVSVSNICNCTSCQLLNFQLRPQAIEASLPLLEGRSGHGPIASRGLGCYLQGQGNFRYNILRLAKTKMIEPDSCQKTCQIKKETTQAEEQEPSNNQALPKRQTEAPIIKVEFGPEIVFTYMNPGHNVELFSWLWKDDSTPKNQQAGETAAKPISHRTEKTASDEQSKKVAPPKKALLNNSLFNFRKDQQLYSEDQIGLLKKKLQFEYKGFLSKSTDTDSTLGVPVIIRFRCKNSGLSNECPFLHVLEYCREEDGKILYRHKPECSSHTPECTLDSENIQYNITARKLDSSMQVLEEIIAENPAIKPKEILEVFAARTGQPDENFLYQGLENKGIKRSIKKYFDNAVAKVKSKLKKQ